ncbi:MAG TPA: hypothetical protein VLX58_14965 [Bryobacteraceae bacterium]|nr:hypothetical protein [Bryobacteraceae bacterium]
MRAKPCVTLFACAAVFAQAPISVTVLNRKNTAEGVKGRLQNFMSTSFQPAEWDDQFFQQIPTASGPLWKLGSQHIRIQPVSQGVPMIAPDQWDFSMLDAVLIPVLSLADHSPELQLATAPSFMNDSQGHILPSHFGDFADYCANVVRYYNKGGFDAGGKHYQSPSPYPITWWGIFNEPNINGVLNTDYVTLYNLVVPAMQAVDPSIKFVAVELSDFGSESQNYIPAFTQGVKAHVDALGTHYYSSCNQSDSDQAVMSSITTFASDVRYLYAQLRTNPALAGVPVWVTENNENADYDQGNGISACNGTPFVLDTRGTSAFFAGWRPYLFSQLAQAGAQSLYHWDYDADAQFGEVDYNSGNTYLSYWVDYYLAHLFPAPPGADILVVHNSNAGALESLAVRNDDGSVVIMLANHHVRSANDNNGPGVPHTVTLDVSALGAFSAATETVIDASTDPAKGPAPQALTPSAQMQIALNGYAVAFLRLYQAAPQFSVKGVGNAASYATGGVSPGEILAVFGQAMGPATLAGAQTSAPGVVANLLAGTRVWFDGTAAPLVYTSNQQLSVIVPYETAGKASTTMQVEYLGVMSDPVSVPVVASVPGLFTKDASGTGQGAIGNQDGSLNSPANPAPRGSVVSLYATGEGQTAPAGVDGLIAGSVLPKPNLHVSATIGGVAAHVAYAGGARGLVAGGIQINVEVPESVAPGDAVPVLVTIGTASSQPGVTLAVQ